MDKIYQILVVNRMCGINSIIPDRYAYTSAEEALKDMNRRIKAFEEREEELNYKGVVKNLADIRNIYKDHNIELETNDAYIYEINIKEKAFQEEIIDNL